MKWHEIIGLIVVWLLGLYLRDKFYEYLGNRYNNDRWKKRGK